MNLTINVLYFPDIIDRSDACGRVLEKNMLRALTVDGALSRTQLLNAELRGLMWIQIKNLGLLRDLCLLHGEEKIGMIDGQALSDPNFLHTMSKRFDLVLPEQTLQCYRTLFAKNGSPVANLVFSINSSFELFINQYSVAQPYYFDSANYTPVELFCNNFLMTAREVGLSGVSSYMELRDAQLLPEDFRIENRFSRPVFQFDDGRKMHWISSSIFH